MLPNQRPTFPHAHYNKSYDLKGGIMVGPSELRDTGPAAFVGANRDPVEDRLDDREEWSPWPGASLRAALRRVAYLWAIAWLLIELVSTLTSKEESFANPRLAVTALGVALVVSVISARVGRAADPTAVATLALATAILGWNIQAPSSVSEPRILFWLPNLVVITAGLLLSARVALLTTVSIALLSGGMLIWRLEGLPHSFLDAGGTAVYALLDGFAAMIVVRAATRAACMADSSVAAAERSRESVELMRVITSETKEIGRIVHDTAMNTLNGIARMNITADIAVIRQQCARDVATIRRLLAEGVVAMRSQSPRWNLVSDNAPLEVRLVGATSAEMDELLAALPIDVAYSVCGAIAESLRNAYRHGHVTWATVLVEEEQALRVTVVDEGRGFDGRFLEGHGLARSVRDRCREAGVGCEVDSVPSLGTRVTLTYIPDSTSELAVDQQKAAHQFLTEIVQSFIWKFSACFVLLCGFFTIITWDSGSLATTGVAFLAVTACVTACRVAYSGNFLPRWATIFAVGVIPVITILPGSSVSGCGRLAMPWWGTDGAVVVCTLLVFLVKSRKPLIAGMCLYGLSIVLVTMQVQVQGSCSDNAISSGLLDATVVLGMEVFRVSLARLATRTSSEQAQAALARSQATAQGARLRVLGARRNTVLRSSLDLLERIAVGDLDPTDVEVRRTCGREESYLREITLLEPGQIFLGDVLAHALSLAHDRGVTLTLRTGQLDVPSRQAGHEVNETLTRILRDLNQNDAATVSLMSRVDVVVMTVVTTRASSPLGISGVDGMRRTDMLHNVSTDQSYVQLEWRRQSED
jgi:hypothetical protein